MPGEETSDLRIVVEDLERRVSALEKLIKEKPEVVSKKVSIAEFLVARKPETDTDKALSIAYYLEFNDGLSTMNLEDIRSGFRKAAIPVPPNLSETLRKNVAKGFLMDSGEQKNGSTGRILTRTGKDYVETNFNRK
jgi:hypothetical protein